MEDSGDLDVLVDRTVKVVGRSGAVGQVEGALALGIARSEDLVDVGFATARLPAGASVILGRAGDAAIESPEGRHIAVEGSIAVKWHLEVEEKDLVGSAEAFVGDVLGAGEAARAVAFFSRENSELLVGGDQSVGEDLWRRCAAITLGVEVREGGAPGAVVRC